MPLPTLAKNTFYKLLRAGFRMTPLLPTSLRDRLRQRFLERYPDWVPTGPRGQMIAAFRTERRPRLSVSGPAVGFRPRQAGQLPSPLPATLIAFYLPQFHPIPENDAWWGTGFTEWQNVARALPQFEGHAQPRLPSELGFYDLRLSEVMRQQMQLAREYGIGAFCSYFYWFGGKTLLELPLQQWLRNASLDLPLCLCWANENWSRRWDGRADHILIGQQHSAEDDLAFIAYISRYLSDPRYLRVDGKPLLLVYRPGLLPDPKATALRWRTWCLEHGIGDIHLAYVQSFDRVDPHDIGFDAAVAFPPNNITLTTITERQQLINPTYSGDVYDWRELARSISEQPDPAYTLFPGVNPGWDNEPRRSGQGRVFAHASPRAYGEWLQKAIAVAQRRSPSSPLVFINAWNEWAEGAVLEPDTRLGFAWLEATRAALQGNASARAPRATRPCAVIHAWYVDVVDELAAALMQSELDWRLVFTVPPEREHSLRERLERLRLNAEIHVFENRGRDILPFLQVADRLLDEGVDVVLKLHTKRSLHRDNGDQWRRELLHKLVAPARARCVWRAFQEDNTLGIAAAEGHILSVNDYLGANAAGIQYLLARLGLNGAPSENDCFLAGSMFWVRLAAVRPLLDANLGSWEFEAEDKQTDGTLAHALERIIGLCVNTAGFEIKDIATIGKFPTTGGSQASTYPYARRSL